MSDWKGLVLAEETAAEIDRLKPKITEVARPRPKGILLPWEDTVIGERIVYVRAKAFSLTLD